MKESDSEMLFPGTGEAFEQLVNENKLLLYSIVYGIAGSCEADDIVQEAFVYAYFHYGALREREKLTSWLCAIARNKAYDSIKRSSKMVSTDVLGNMASAVTPETAYIRREEKNRLMNEISALPEKNRETVMLFYFAGRRIREISEILAIPEGTVKFRLSESRKKLRKELIDMMREEKKTVAQKEIFTRIREETEKAQKAIVEHKTKEASDLCDAMLQKIGDLSALSAEELSILSSLYQTKFRSVRYAEDLKAADQYLKKTVEIAEASGSAEWMSGAYSYYATELSNIKWVCKKRRNSEIKI